MVWKWGAGYAGVSSTDHIYFYTCINNTLQFVKLPTYMYA